MNIRKFKWILAFVGAIAIVLLLRGFAFTSCLIPSTGMENSLFQGERILVNKWSYGLRLPLMSAFSYHRWRERPVQKRDIVVFNNPAGIQQPTIDRREIYISRCIGTPGDTLLVDSLFSVSSPEAQFNPDKKRLYTYPASKENLITSLIRTLSITNDGLMGSDDSTHVRSFSRYEYYLLEQAIGDRNWIRPLTEKQDKELKPLIVPSKGKALRVYPWNITLLRNTLVMHEGKQAEIKNDTLYIDGKPTQHCFFTKDYYWMASNNSVNLSDSRLFGFVPQDHMIGKASLIWFSKEKGTGILDGYRWNRFFQSVK
ncbi:signal peptidase I [Bacteroides faecis]|uniref:signal peptidase I n=1 Tax=Bacteroides faecis TaxID=674529 RepID=UPI0010204BDC|nr:signal peptidase I [Bacteroides faecis]KAA5268185.1 signal peptidase I [Bacteroides faecis]MCE9011034.1 signal peptidase I [Bacteroides faecis]RYT86740.1 signal peptidase I [Bacteroides faecis]